MKKRARTLRIIVRQPFGVSGVREDSEECARLAAEFSKRGDRVLDVGTGTGFIAIYLAKRSRTVDAIDISPAAVRHAAENVARNNVGACVRVFQSNLLDKVSGRYDLIVSNLPILGGSEQLKSVVRRIPGIDVFRPLFCSLTGSRLRLLDRLCEQGREHLSKKGRIVVNLSAKETSRVFEKHGFKIIKKVEKNTYPFTVAELVCNGH